MKSTILFILTLSSTAVCFAQSDHTESLTITTYYPSPYGSYNELSVGKGGLKLGKVVDNVFPNKWTDIDIIPSHSAGLFIATVVQKDDDLVSTSQILFSASGKDIGLQLMGLPVTSNAKVGKEHLTETESAAQFRAQYLESQDSFILQVMPNKECKVYIGKILSYSLNKNQR